MAAAVDPAIWHAPRTLHPTGGLISSVRDQLRYAAFHLGDGTAPTAQAADEEVAEGDALQPGTGRDPLLRARRDGGDLATTPEAEGVRSSNTAGTTWVSTRASSWSPSGGSPSPCSPTRRRSALLDEFDYDWALRRFVGVSNLPAKPQTLSRRELAPYEGIYTGRIIDPVFTPSGTEAETRIELRGTPDGQLRMRRTDTLDPAVLDDPSAAAGAEDEPAALEQRLVFYRKDYVRVYDQSGKPTPQRADFLRGHDGPWIGCAWAVILLPAPWGQVGLPESGEEPRMVKERHGGADHPAP